MKRLILSLFVTVFALAGCGAAGGVHTPVRSPDSLHEHIGNSTVALVVRKEIGDDDNKHEIVLPYCTGVWVGADEILTAKHCVEHDDDSDATGDKVYYTIQSEVHEFLEEPDAIHLAKVAAVDDDHDLAVIKAVAAGVPPHEVAALATELPAIGEHVFSVGHPKGLYWTYAEGTVSAYREESVIGKVVQVNASIWYGNSGGGVFDSSGHLLGICSRLTRVPQMNLYIHLDSIKHFLKEYHEPTPNVFNIKIE